MTATPAPSGDPGTVRATPGEYEGVTELILDRPDRRNALTPEMLTALAERTEIHAPKARVLLLRGEGRTFCAGFDLDRCVDDSDVLRDLLRALAKAIDSLRRAECAVVCAVHGAAIAGGCALLGGADIVVSHADAKLGYPVTRLGISPAVSAPFLSHSTGGRARHMLLRPEIITGTRAYDIGLVHHLAEDRESVLAQARSIAATLAQKPGIALTSTRAWIRELESLTQPTGAARSAMETSINAVGSEEQIQMLNRVWSAR